MKIEQEQTTTSNQTLFRQFLRRIVLVAACGFGFAVCSPAAALAKSRGYKEMVVILESAGAK